MALFKCCRCKAPQKFSRENFIWFSLQKFSPLNFSMFTVATFVGWQCVGLLSTLIEHTLCQSPGSCLWPDTACYDCIIINT